MLTVMMTTATTKQAEVMEINGDPQSRRKKRLKMFSVRLLQV
jgi:hypothetical protein